MKIAYIAHKVGDDVQGNVKAITAIVRTINLTEPDIIPFAPYISDVIALEDSNPVERARGFKNNKYYFQKGIIDELWLFGPYISAGMLEEIKWAKLYGIPIVNKTTGDQRYIEMLLNDTPEYLKYILEVITDTFRIDVAHLKGKSRKRVLVIARHIFVGFCLELMPDKVNTVTLGNFLNRDHSTIIHSKNVFANMDYEDQKFRSFYNIVKAKLRLIKQN